MVPEIERSEPPYAQVVAYIRRQILGGELQPGDMVPSARKITQQWRVSLATATKVLAALRAEGLAEGHPGVGTIVSASASHPRTPRDRALMVRRTGRIYLPGEYARIIDAEMVPAPARIADALGLVPDAAVVRRHRVTYRGEIPMSASTSWFDGRLAEAAPLLLSKDRLKQGTWRYIEEVTGRTVVTGRDQLSASAASEEDHSDLMIDVGTPVLRGRNWFLDAEDAAVEYGESVAKSDRWSTYEYDVQSTREGA